MCIMAFVSNMTRAQKEQYVIELYKQDKTIREITQRVHMSPRDIGVIIKKVKLEVERERGQLEEKDDYDIESKSKTTQAIKLFSEGKNRIIFRES
jgi:intein-encoded DNA endonuclease-like protein